MEEKYHLFIRTYDKEGGHTDSIVVIRKSVSALLDTIKHLKIPKEMLRVRIERSDGAYKELDFHEFMLYYNGGEEILAYICEVRYDSIPF